MKNGIHIIVDIDGTVADHEGIRGHYDYDQVLRDKPNQPVIDAVRAMYDNGFSVIYLSGRPDSCKDDTTEWLDEHVKLGTYIGPFMRTTGDKRPDYIVKEELYRQHIEPYYNVHSAWDDRTQVVKMWRSIGLTVFQVAEGNF